MPAVLLVTASGAPDIGAALAAQGVTVAARCGPDRLVVEAARSGADAVVAWDAYPAAGLLAALATLRQHAPCPVLLFTDDGDAGTLDAALQAGVHAYVVKGYDPARLRPLLQLARARFERDAALHAAHAELAGRYEERKLVERAKGILMREQQISEDEAFRQLRQASMHGQEKVGQVSRRVIDAARDTDAVNRAGQLRMLSQRLVKLYALRCAGVDAAAAELAQQQSARQVADNLAALGKGLSRPTFGDLLDGVEKAWAALQPVLRRPPRVEHLIAADDAAEQLLRTAEALTTALEVASALRTLTVVNRAGRQRMLSQRLAKQALLGTLGDGDVAQAAAADAVRSVESFELALRQLGEAPLSSPEIRSRLEAAMQVWRELLAGLAEAGTGPGRARIAAASEALLDHFERLTALYARAAQVLLET
ncbi:MAG: type IV pili methyl-accepting chemotaxis transducer N-terminal domain-containing protein [Piscinibacter sp.]|nr:type IV pili methyl-accepting chemotaxis transducer N-terminal domain-containing protein [Piscinibacter sp.]